VLLNNPLSFVLFVIASWRFFVDRIATEEQTLLVMFKDQYRKYRAATPTWIPFIP
jgi:protein-S-isoprenylcysteine O-methyltransferase Ste14